MKIEGVLTSCLVVIATLGVLGCATVVLAEDESVARKPNIVIIMSDDMGYSDIGCYGGEINTPALDAMAASGLRYTQFYNTGRCCPTRASLLTGLYPHQTGVGFMVKNEGRDGYRGDLNRRCRTIAEVLGPAGYKNYAIGKWHVTKFTDPKTESEKSNWPLQRGFDHYYGIINGASSLWDPNSLVRDNRSITCVNDPDYKPTQPYHLTDAISDNAVSYIEQHDAEQPFFMYVSYTAAHWPLHARDSDIRKYDGAYDAGYDAVRKQRFEKMKKLGIVGPESLMTKTVGDWERVNEIQDWETACMEVYAAMVEQMDRGIGSIVDAIKRKGQLENTIVMYLQDNGGCAESAGRSDDPAKAKLRGDKPTLKPIADAKRHYFSSVPEQTRDGWPVRRGHVMPGPADTYIGYGKNWANVSNTPFREYKHWVHEGGIATPLIVQWPARISAKGGFRRQPSHLIDLMATCVDVAQADYPLQFGGEQIVPLQGNSLVSSFAGDDKKESDVNDDDLDGRVIFWEHEGNKAIRVGKWKLVAKGARKSRKKPIKWELYDMDMDRVEMNDLSAEKPELTNRLSELWKSYAIRTGVIPYPQFK